MPRRPEVLSCGFEGAQEGEDIVWIRHAAAYTGSSLYAEKDCGPQTAGEDPFFRRQK